MNRLMKLNTFWLRIIALIAMTFDHIGVLLPSFTSFGMESNLVIAFRIIGRIAFPLFVFLEIEAIRHTSNPYKYLFRILLLTITTVVAHVLLYHFFDTYAMYIRNPILDIFLIALGFYLIHRKDKFSYFSLLPIGYLVLNSVLNILEQFNDYTITWLPFYVRTGYGLFGVAVALACYFSATIARMYSVKKYPDISLSEILNSLDFQYYRNVINVILQVLILITISLLPYINIKLLGIFQTWQSYFALSLIPLLLYNGKLGYKAKWFKYASYFYFPLHIVIIYLIFYIFAI